MDRQERHRVESDLTARMHSGAVAASVLASGTHPPETVRELTRHIVDGQRAREEFVELNLGLVHHFVRRMRIPANDEDDAMQDGLCGLLRAVDGFDPQRGRFAAYAAPWIIAAIQDGRARQLDIGVRAVRRRSGIRRTQQLLTQTTGREPTMTEVALAAGVSIAVVEQALRPAEYVDVTDVELPHLEPGFEQVDGPDVDVGQLLTLVCEEDRAVIAARFGLDGNGERGLQEVSVEAGLSIHQVRRRIARGLAVMRGGVEVQRAA